MIITAFGTGVALVALVVSMVVARRQTGIQERVAAIEEARRAEEVEARTRARVTVSISREGSRTQLVLRNDGPAMARGVDFDIASLDGHRSAPSVNGREVLPVDLQSDQAMSFGIPLAMGDSMAARVTVRWSDGAGGHAEPFALSFY